MNKLTNKKIVFIGDSITECFDLKKHFPSFNIINEGISGNTTIDILNRLNEILSNHQPEIVFLLIGTNDLQLTNLTKEEVILNIKLIVKKIKTQFKNVKIYLQSIYPVFYEIKPFSVGKRKNEDIIYINNKLKEIKGINYIDMHKVLKDENGKLNKNYTYDGIHINDLGYKVIKQKLEKYLKELD